MPHLQILFEDLNSLELFTELKNLCYTVPSDINSPSQTLKYLFSRRFQDVKANIVIALRILLIFLTTITLVALFQS